MLKSLSCKSSKPAGESLRPVLLKSERALVDFIFVRNRAGERDRFPAEWDRWWLLGRDNILGADKKLLCPYVWREIRLLNDSIRPGDSGSEMMSAEDLLGHDEFG